MNGSSDVVDRVCEHIEAKYPFPETAARAAEALRVARDGWHELHGTGLAEAVTATLHEQTADLHLRLRWSEKGTENSPDDQWADPAFLAAYWSEQDYYNQGISKAERLPGNIGLLVVHSLDEPEGTGAVMEAAFAFLARTDALIVDVRDSNGGAPSGVAFFVSHLLSPPARKLITTLDRDNAVVEQSWTSAYVRGPRYVDKPVFVLTSARTPSGAEELAYDLQALRRAQVVGERTVGAANPVGLFVVGDQFLLQLPVVTVRHAVTNSNWEGTGVEPDVVCVAADGLDVAMRAAARAILDGPQRADRPAEVTAELRALAGLH